MSRGFATPLIPKGWVLDLALTRQRGLELGCAFMCVHERKCFRRGCTLRTSGTHSGVLDSEQIRKGQSLCHSRVQRGLLHQCASWMGVDVEHACAVEVSSLELDPPAARAESFVVFRSQKQGKGILVFHIFRSAALTQEQDSRCPLNMQHLYIVLCRCGWTVHTRCNCRREVPHPPA